MRFEATAVRLHAEGRMLNRIYAAQTPETGFQIIAGIVVVSAAVVVGIVLIVLHEKHKTRSVTGCVASGSLTDDKDKQVYLYDVTPDGQ